MTFFKILYLTIREKRGKNHTLNFTSLLLLAIPCTVPLLLVTKAPRRMLNLSVQPAIYHIWHSNVGKMHFYLFTLPTKVRLVKAMVFPVVMFGCESWTMKKAEHRRIDAFELWCWRRLLRVPWTARRSNQSIQRRSVLGVLWKDWC